MISTLDAFLSTARLELYASTISLASAIPRVASSSPESTMFRFAPTFPSRRLTSSAPSSDRGASVNHAIVGSSTAPTRVSSCQIGSFTVRVSRQEIESAQRQEIESAQPRPSLMKQRLRDWQDSLSGKSRSLVRDMFAAQQARERRLQERDAARERFHQHLRNWEAALERGVRMRQCDIDECWRKLKELDRYDVQDPMDAFFEATTTATPQELRRWRYTHDRLRWVARRHVANPPH